MLFGLNKTYESGLTEPEIQDWLAYLAAKRRRRLNLETQAYEVRPGAHTFAVRKYTPSHQGQNYPWICGTIVGENPTRLRLRIRPAYLTLAFVAVLPCVLLPVVWLADNMTINGEDRVATVTERLLFSLLVMGVVMLIGYGNAIRPMQAAEAWLIRKLQLRELPLPQ